MPPRVARFVVLRARLARWLAKASALSLLSLASPAHARSAGVIATGCDACHTGGNNPTVTLTAEPERAEVGSPITLTIAVSQTNGSAAGFYLTTTFDAPGTFRAVESGTATSTWGVLHTTPRAGSGGVTTFKATWTASESTGVTFDVYVISANGDRSNRGDGAGTAHLAMTVGCTGTDNFIDQDGDGHGSPDPAYPTRIDCSPPPGYAPTNDDCNDFQASVYPGADELCDLKDNDCDGEVDNDLVYQAYCADADGDGHGAIGGTTMMDCKPSPGFGPCDDCDDRDSTTYPGATEVCDGRDNTCEGTVDEGVRLICGVGLCARYARGCSTTCFPGQPFDEYCNDYDDDCDGIVDNGTNETLCGDPGLECIGGTCVGEPVGIVDAGAPDPADGGAPDPLDAGTPDPTDGGTPEPTGTGATGGSAAGAPSSGSGGSAPAGSRTPAAPSSTGCSFGPAPATRTGAKAVLLLVGLLGFRRRRLVRRHDGDFSTLNRSRCRSWDAL